MSVYIATACRRLFNLDWVQISGHPVTLQDDEIERSTDSQNNPVVNMFNQYTAPNRSEEVLVFEARARIDIANRPDANIRIRTTHTIRYIPATIVTQANNITSSTATLGGHIKTYGGTVLKRGILFSRTEGETLEVENENLDRNIVVPGVSNPFRWGFKYLAPGRTYYCRAYVVGTNKAGTKTVTNYGEIRSFTTLRLPTTELRITSSARTAINYNVSASVSPNQRDFIKEVGSLFSSSNTEPEIGGANVTKRVQISRTESDDVQSESYSSVQGNLSPNTTYYFRSYVISKAGTAYSEVINASTLGPPKVNTPSASDIASTTTTLNGNITSDGGAEITERGFVYTSSNLSSEDLIIDATDVSKEIVEIPGAPATGVFSKNITGLTAGTTYYCRAYASNSEGTTYGDIESFTTLATSTAPKVIEISIDPTGMILTMQTSKTVKLNNADNDDFIVTSTLNGVTTNHEVTNIEKGSIVLTVTPAVPAGATVSISYDPTQGSSTDAIIDNEGNDLLTFDGMNVLHNGDFKLSGISILPNPTSGILNITAVEKADYRLFNIKGQILKKGTLIVGKNKINISSFVKGIYLLNIKTDKGSFTKKVVRD